MKIIRYALLGVCSVFLLSGCSSGKEADTPASSTEIKVSVTAKSDPATSETVSTRSSDTQTTDTQTTQSSSETESVASQGVRLSDAQREQINLAFLEWAGQRAAIGNMAVSGWYFDHGAAGRGDWYANTPDGQVQVQNQDLPGKSAFPIRAIGGCVFYTSKDGGIGKQELAAGSFAENYSVKMDFTKPVSKYLLGDNGVVYELKSGNGEMVSTNTGFGEYADDGSVGEYTPRAAFQISEDQAAQEKLQELIQRY
ncbi:hypothetical protein [Enterococcus hulanensis]|uniref:hypothetical protein n=1 Tax=Enterococcus hulanensis TaxID=2559929 RepID=UPI0010F468F9|nr:hypothetical protein [Enterococcus hulanensis]